jgi:hypothetical protein
MGEASLTSPDQGEPSNSCDGHKHLCGQCEMMGKDTVEKWCCDDSGNDSSEQQACPEEARLVSGITERLD